MRSCNPARLSKNLKALFALMVFFGACVAVTAVGGSGLRDVPNPLASAHTVSSLFTPSNARTEDGGLVAAEQFFPASRCAVCHKDTHAAWSESLHRNAGREPFYKESVDILRRTRGSEPTQHCESCHAPISVFSGSLLRGGRESVAAIDEGVTCTVCHSITETRLDGTGSYTIRRPALLAREDGKPIYGDMPDAAIMADVPGHRRAMMRPLLKTPEFCAACHKSSAPPELNGYKFLRGFSTYDEWQQSGASLESVAPYYRREKRADCRACHMAKVESLDDFAAKGKVISSHRWLGANTITPLFYEQTKQVQLTEEFLKAKVLSVDIFALKSGAAEKTIAPLDNSRENCLTLQPGEEVTAEVVIFNRKAAHSFPPELRDMYEPWVEFEALDSSGKTIFHSGSIRADGTLDETAHVYKQILLDDSSRAITRHQVWESKVKAYDNFIPAGRADIARFRFRIPKDGKTGAFTSVTLRASVNYRRFIQEYTDYVLRRQNVVHLNVPVVRMASAEVKITGQPRKDEKGLSHRSPDPLPKPELQAIRWNDYGIGLLEQAQYTAAAEAFRHAAELSPKDPNPLVSASIAELRTEQFGFARDQLRKASELLDRALKLNPALARTRFYHALVLRSQGKASEAVGELTKLATEYPRDREVARQLGQTLYTLGRITEARAAFEAVNLIDPTDAGAFQFLAPIYESEGLKSEAGRAQGLYLLWREDPLADSIAARFFALFPQWADERVPAHTHGDDSPQRPGLTGLLAAPDR